jgi:hypothetical protein
MIKIKLKLSLEELSEILSINHDTRHKQLDTEILPFHRKNIDEMSGGKVTQSQKQSIVF